MTAERITKGEADIQIPERVLSPKQKAELYAAISGSVERTLWPAVEKSLDAAGEEFQYGLFQMKIHGHEIGVTREERDCRRGFRFDSCSAESPKGIRDIDYFDAETTAENGWGVPLMSPEIFEELRVAGIITNKDSWDHLKTEGPGTKENPGLSKYGLRHGVEPYSACSRAINGGFRCSLWVLEV